MRDMVERVARALCKWSGIEPDSYDGPISSIVVGQGSVDINYSKEKQPAWMRFESSAEQAIAAMREPTEAMERTGNITGWDMDGRSSEVWRAMVDSALRD